MNGAIHRPVTADRSEQSPPNSANVSSSIRAGYGSHLRESCTSRNLECTGRKNVVRQSGMGSFFESDSMTIGRSSQRRLMMETVISPRSFRRDVDIPCRYDADVSLCVGRCGQNLTEGLEHWPGACRMPLNEQSFTGVCVCRGVDMGEVLPCRGRRWLRDGVVNLNGQRPDMRC